MTKPRKPPLIIQAMAEALECEVEVAQKMWDDLSDQHRFHIQKHGKVKAIRNRLHLEELERRRAIKPASTVPVPEYLKQK